MIRLTVITILIAGCRDYCEEYDPFWQEPVLTGRVSIYVEPHPDIPPSAVLEGCEMWLPEGADCELVTSPGIARVDVWASQQLSCVEKDGLVIADAGLGRINVYIPCLHRSHDVEPSDGVIATIIAHEIGHLFGIKHVPRSCDHPRRSLNKDDKIPYDLSGEMLCGPGVMNAQPCMLGEGLPGISNTDHAAFEARDTNIALF